MPTIEQLESLLQKDPDDAFLNYGLAMALVAAGRTEEAIERLERTIEVDADYVAAYFQKGRVLAGAGDTDAARATIRRGLEVAAATGDDHAHREMSEFLDTL